VLPRTIREKTTSGVLKTQMLTHPLTFGPSPLKRGVSIHTFLSTIKNMILTLNFDGETSPLERGNPTKEDRGVFPFLENPEKFQGKKTEIIF
jgi:hypothetical protein